MTRWTRLRRVAVDLSRDKVLHAVLHCVHLHRAVRFCVGRTSDIFSYGRRHERALCVVSLDTLQRGTSSTSAREPFCNWTELMEIIRLSFLRLIVGKSWSTTSSNSDWTSSLVPVLIVARWAPVEKVKCFYTPRIGSSLRLQNVSRLGRYFLSRFRGL